MTDHGIRDEWSTRKDGERGEQGNQVWEVSRRHFASPWLSNRYCTLETIQKGSASRARERCLCLRPMLHGNHAGAPLLPPFYSFPLCTMRCSVILLPLTFMLLSDRTIDRRWTLHVFCFRKIPIINFQSRRRLHTILVNRIITKKKEICVCI